MSFQKSDNGETAEALEAEAQSWRVEAACLNAWPSPQQIVTDGWVLRSSGGPTRRTNSANPLHAGARADEALINRAEAFYAAQGRPVIFRVPDMADAIDPLLAARGYAREAPTRTLFAELDEVTATMAADAEAISVEPSPTRRWLAARDRLSGSNREDSRAYRAIIGTILLPCGFVAAEYRGRIVSLGFGAIQDDLLVIESVVTDPATRRRGFARTTLSALVAWARGKGARSAALQVVADNAAALALYAGLGFRRDIYGYHYRAKR